MKGRPTPKRPPRDEKARRRTAGGTFKRYDDLSPRALTLLPRKVRARRRRRTKNKIARASRKANR